MQPTIAQWIDTVAQLVIALLYLLPIVTVILAIFAPVGYALGLLKEQSKKRK